MRSDVATDLGDSAFDFLRLVWPAIKHRVGGGRLVSMEVSEVGTGLLAELAHGFDILAGIDAWQMVDEAGVIRGIASRVQWGDRNWQSFTIREQRPNGARTEFAKRCEALDRRESGWLFPYLTVQAYATEPRRHGEFLGAAVMRTVDLYGYARANWDKRESKRNPQDGVLFKPWFWSELRRAGCRVDVVGPPEPESDLEPALIATKDLLKEDGENWPRVARPPDWQAP